MSGPFGATLQLLRQHSGVSLRALAGHVGVSAAYLSRVEHGHDPAPAPERVVAIARALGLPADLMLELADEVRGDAMDWLQSSPTGRRLGAALRRRRLGEAELARVLAFVEEQFPLPTATLPALATMLPAAHIVLGVRLSTLEDAWTVAALRLQVHTAAGVVTPIGNGMAIGHARGPGAPQVGLLLCEEPVGSPGVRAIWIVDQLDEGPTGARLLARLARLADADLVATLVRADSAEEVLRLLKAHERRAGLVGPEQQG